MTPGDTTTALADVVLRSVQCVPPSLEPLIALHLTLCFGLTTELLSEVQTCDEAEHAVGKSHLILTLP